MLHFNKYNITGISPDNNKKIHTQNYQFGDTGDSGDIIHSSSSLPLYRLGHSNTFACKDCKQKGDKWFSEFMLSSLGQQQLSIIL